jgi:hypothetical protein
MGVFSSEREQALGLLRPKSRGGEADESGKVSRMTEAKVIGTPESFKETKLIILAIFGSSMLPHNAAMLTEILSGNSDITLEEAIGTSMPTHIATILTEVLSGESDITLEEAIEALFAGFHAMYR